MPLTLLLAPPLRFKKLSTPLGELCAMRKDDSKHSFAKPTHSIVRAKLNKVEIALKILLEHQSKYVLFISKLVL